jgi:hypothetical protein
VVGRGCSRHNPLAHRPHCPGCGYETARSGRPPWILIRISFVHEKPRDIPDSPRNRHGTLPGTCHPSHARRACLEWNVDYSHVTSSACPSQRGWDSSGYAEHISLPPQKENWLSLMFHRPWPLIYLLYMWNFLLGRFALSMGLRAITDL